MSSIRYEAPRSLAQAVGLLASDPHAKVIAGGTDLLVQFRMGVTRPAAFVDIKRIPELVGMTLTEDGLRLGAATPAVEICEHADVARLWPGLVEAIHLIGSTQIQGRATVGGNLCNASPAADTTCALMVNRAECLVAGPGGDRTIPVEDFCLSPGRTALQRGELLVAVHVPQPEPRTSDAYLRLIPRSEMDIAIAGAAVSVTLDGDEVCTAARVAIAAVAPTALLVREAAQALIGTRVDERARRAAGEAASRAARPISDKRGTVAYRRAVTAVLARRAAENAAERARRLTA